MSASDWQLGREDSTHGAGLPN